MTIETKIAKNGSKRYYVRDDNGKLSQISRQKAYELQTEADNQIMANLFEQTAEEEMTNIEQANYIARVDIETPNKPTVYIKYAINLGTAAEFIRLCDNTFGKRLINADIRDTKNNTVNAEDTTKAKSTEKKLYKVFQANHDDEVPQETATKLDIIVDEKRVNVSMYVNRKTLTSAYNVFTKALEQAVADGVISDKAAQFGYFADDINDIDFGGKDYYEAHDSLDNSFAYGIDDNTCTDSGFYFWFWTNTDNGEDDNNDAEATTATDANEEIINCNEIKAATTDVTNAPEVTRFQKNKTYRYYDINTGEPLWYITIEKRTNTTVTVSGEKFKVFIQPHDRMLNYDKPTESFIRGNYRIDAADACEETADEITPSTLQKFIEAKKEVSYWRNSTGARIWQIAYIRYGVNGGFVGQTPWLNRTMKEADRYLKDEYGMTLLEYLAAEDKWNDTDKDAILKDKIERDSKTSVETMPALFPAEDGDDDELIDEPEIGFAENVFIGQDGTNYIIRAKNINITVEDRKIKINGHVVAKYKTDAGVNAALKYVTDWRNNIANYKTFDINDWNTIFDDFDFAGGNEDKFVYIDDEPSPTDKVITPDEMLALVGTLETVNAAAPYGWQISYDGKNFPVEFNGKTVATLDSLALAKVLPPDKFFEQFNPDVPHKEHYLNERRKELDMLLDFRKFVEDDPDRLKTLANLIEDVKREILNAELDTEHPPDIEFDEHGEIIPWF